MYVAVLRKEYREHRSIWLALAILGAGFLLGVPKILPPSWEGRLFMMNMLTGTAFVFAWVYGIVCGSMLLAGEREGATQTFLDMLPRSRLHVWLGKFLAGAIFVALQVAVLLANPTLWDLFPSTFPRSFDGQLVLVYFGASGFAWGLLFSALCGNVLLSIALTILLQFIGSLIVHTVVIVGLFLLQTPFGENWTDGELPLYLTLSLSLALPFLLSALLYSRVDLGRLANPKTDERLEAQRWWAGAWQALWLSWRQTRGLFLAVMLFSLFVGFVMTAVGLYVYPVATLFIGVLFGASIFSDEQRGARAFLAVQRLSLGRIWLVKVSLRLLFTGFCSCLVFLPLVIGMILAQMFGTQQMQHLESPLVISLVRGSVSLSLFVFLWPAFGFAVGSVFGLLFRNLLVSLVVSFGMGALLVSLWIPSLFVGGLEAWQVMGIPLVLLACSRLLMHPWATDELLSWPTVRLLAATVLVCAALLAVGLWYRVVEFPDAPEPEGYEKFVASLPTPEENEAGRLIHEACARLERESKESLVRPPFQPRFPGDGRWPDLMNECRLAIAQGWPNDDFLNKWLDGVFKNDWREPLEKASRLPVGVVDDPRKLTLFDQPSYPIQARDAGTLLAARSLQFQKRKDDPIAFIDILPVALTLVRNLQNHARNEVVTVAANIEAEQMEALTRWLEQLAARPDLLARAASILRSHRESLPMDYRDQRYAEYMITLNTVEQEKWLKVYGMARNDDELAFLSACWHVPWEAERKSRLLRLWGVELMIEQRSGAFNSWTLLPLRRWIPGQIGASRPRREVTLDVAEVMLALRRFQADTGRPAEQLDQLVPKYLSRIPADPFDYRPLRYRLSRGETINWECDVLHAAGIEKTVMPRPPVLFLGLGPIGLPVVLDPRPYWIVPAGQGILWSVGEDLRDDGAKRQGRWSRWIQNRVMLEGEDLIYLVPLPARKRP